MVVKSNVNDNGEQLATREVLFLMCWVCWIFFLGNKPIHLDETNFLMLTKGDWWAPHLVRVNWGGSMEPAFDVLSNPPGMSWLLWGMKALDPLWMRIMTLPWALVSLWSVFRIGQYWGVGRVSLVVFAVSPFFGLSHNTLMPDMVLFALVAIGWQGILSGRRVVLWSMILGASALFRYSGLTMIPLLWCWLFVYRPKNSLHSAAMVLVPSLLLMLHDVWAYGEWHFWHMIDFQQGHQSLSTLFHKMGAFSAMLGAAFALAFRPDVKTVGFGVLWGVGLVVVFQYAGIDWSVWSLFWMSYGACIWVHAARFWFGERRVFLCWILGALFFLFSLRFAATRYWGPFIIPFIIAGSKELGGYQKKYIVTWIFYWAFITSHLVWDDRKLAESQRDLALFSMDQCSEIGYFSGHWGWQYYLEQSGWIPVDDDSLIPNNVCFVEGTITWPQEISNTCWDEEKYKIEKFSSWSLPIRVHSADAKSNYHSFYISNKPPIQTLTPWGFGEDSWGESYFRRSCRF